HLQFAADTTVDGTPGAATTGPTTPRPPPAPPVLVGLTEGERRYAYVLNDGQTTRAGLWDKVGKWRVTAIGPQGVTLTAGSQTLRLTFYGPRPEPPPLPTVTADATPPPAQASPTAAPATPAPPPRPRGLEPASAPTPSPHGPGGHRPRYWVGPADLAPPGYVVLKPGELPPAQ
ncbi:MAG TPA: hypothetical protein VHW60_09440, partial [Caulobacteraceae bacterium]|nr:hypothetical protein [Caulobacteraceae bacterium]